MDRELLAKFVAGECTSEEEAWIEEEMQRDPNVQAQVKRLRQVWKACRRTSNEWDVEDGWNECSARIRADRNEKELTSADRRVRDRGRRPSGNRRRSSRSRARKWGERVGVAALLLFGIVAATYFTVGEGRNAAAGNKVYATKKGQRATIRLVDGTQVRLNVDTKLAVAESFNDERRSVRLDGEAYFEVKSDSTRPFVVHTGEARIRVRGTKFNVLSYPDQNETAVAVTEGEVALQPLQSVGADSTAVLHQQSLGVVSKEGLEPVRRGMRLDAQVAWMEGKLVFQDASLQEVERKLERWYGLEVMSRVKPHGIVGLNASFKDEPIDEVLQTIGTALGLKHIRDGEQVTFYR